MRPRCKKFRPEFLLYGQACVVEYERRLQAVIFGSGEADLHRLPLEVDHAEGVLLISGCMVQVGERSQRGQNGSRRIEHLHLQHIIGGGGGGFGGIDVQEEAQGGGGDIGWNRDRLCSRIGMRATKTIEPRIPLAAMWRFLAGVVDHLRGQGPRRGLGAVFKPRVAEELLCPSRADRETDRGGLGQTSRSSGDGYGGGSSGRRAARAERERAGSRGARGIEASGDTSRKARGREAYASVKPVRRVDGNRARSAVALHDCQGCR